MTPADGKRRLTTMVSTMDKLLALLIDHPHAVLESGVVIPCGLLAILEVDDDENIRTSHPWVDSRGFQGTLRALTD